MVTYISRSIDFTYILTTICGRNIIKWILVSCDTMIDLEIYLGQCDLYMVQSFLPYILNTM